MKNICVLLLLSINAIAQSVTINPQANGSGIINAQSTSSGMLVPRMATSLRIAIISPQKGLLIFDDTTNTYWFYNGSSWVELVNGGNSGGQWTVAGNDQYSDNSGNVGIGIETPRAKLQVNTNLNTQVIFGGDGAPPYGVSIQKNWPTIGFNQYRNSSNLSSSIGFSGGYGYVNYLNPNLGHLYWNATNASNQQFLFTQEVTRMVLTNNGSLGLGNTDPQAQLHVSGFTKLGNEAPAIKLKVYTGTTCTHNACGSSFPHGLNAANIIQVFCSILDVNGFYWQPDIGDAGQGNYQVNYTATNIYINHPASGTSSILNRPYRVVVVYSDGL